MLYYTIQYSSKSKEKWGKKRPKVKLSTVIVCECDLSSKKIYTLVYIQSNSHLMCVIRVKFILI